jgi:hypothetical protein
MTDLWKGQDLGDYYHVMIANETEIRVCTRGIRYIKNKKKKKTTG